MLGFERLGIPVETGGQGLKIGVSPFTVFDENGEGIRCGLDIGCLQKYEISRGRGEHRPWWEGEEGIFFFKVHAHPSALSEARRIFPMPQSLGRNAFVDAIPALRKQRAERHPTLDIFGVMTAGGLRAAACAQIKGGPWRSLVGIMKERKGSEIRSPASVRVPPIEATAYFRTMAQSRLALSLPSHGGNDGPWCSYRHVEAWALGVPVLTLRPKDYHVFNVHAAGGWFEIADDLSNLRSVLGQLLADADGVREAGERAATYYDENFSPERHAVYVLETIKNNRRTQ
jgi:hypothetical protein